MLNLNWGQIHCSALNTICFTLQRHKAHSCRPRSLCRLTLDIAVKLAESINQLCWNISCFKLKFWSWSQVFAHYTKPRVLRIHTVVTYTSTWGQLEVITLLMWHTDPLARYRLDTLLPTLWSLFLPDVAGTTRVDVWEQSLLPCFALAVTRHKLLPLWQLRV